MGQATADLPDPVSQAEPGATAASSADDLLAQLAGDEIDRLLSEAEDERQGESARDATAADEHSPAPPPADQAAAARVIEAGVASVALATGISDPPAPPQPPAPEAPVARAVAPAPNPPAPVARPAPAEEASAPELQSQLDDLFNELTQEPGGEAEPEPVAPVVEAVAVVPAPVEAPATVAAPASMAAEVAAELDADEASRNVTASLSAALQEATAAPGSLGPVVAIEEHEPEPADPRADEADDGPGPLPFYLRPLEWLNAPFAACPDHVRQALGKVALVTLFNAAAVLVYVLFFRRGH